MTEENDTGKHEFNFFLDKQIQQKLLEADDLIAAKETALYKNLCAYSKAQTPSNTNNSGTNSYASNAVGVIKNSQPKLTRDKDFFKANICGWCSGSGVAYRKTDSELPVRGRGQQSYRDGYSRDSKIRPYTHNPQDFIFRHYADPRRYIEQYRKEHTCYDTTTTSATRSEFLETRRFYAYNQYSPLAVGSQSATTQVNSPLPASYQETAFVTPEQAYYSQKKQQQPPPTLQYTNRRDQTKQTISANLRPSNAVLTKLSKSNVATLDNPRTPDQTQEWSESSQRVGPARGRASPGVNGLSFHKSLNGNTPPDQERLSARGSKSNPNGIPLDPNIPNQFLGRKLGQVTAASGQTRTLDALASQSGDIGGKQISGVEATSSQGEEVTDCATWWAEVRLEQLRRVNRRLLAPPAAPSSVVPQLTYIRAGEQQGKLGDKGNNRFMSGWRGENSNSFRPPASDPRVMIPATGNSFDSVDGESDASSLRPNHGGSSDKTNLTSGSNNSSSNKTKELVKSKNVFNLEKEITREQNLNKDATKRNTATGSTSLTNTATRHKNAIKAKSVEQFRSSTSEQKSSANPFVTSASSDLAATQVTQGRERARTQQTALTASRSDPVKVVSRWAAARKQEELSSVAHARRIKHLIEQSRKCGVSVGEGSSGRGFMLGRSLSEGGREEREKETLRHLEDQHQGALKVEGMQTQYKGVTTDTPSTCGQGYGKDNGSNLEQCKNKISTSGHDMEISQLVLPPVGTGTVQVRAGDKINTTPGNTKTREHNSQGKQTGSSGTSTSAVASPMLGDLLDSQTFFSHGVSAGHLPVSTNTREFQHQHYHHSPGRHHQTSDKQHPKAGHLKSSSVLKSNAGLTAPAAKPVIVQPAPAPMVSEPSRQPKLKYSSSSIAHTTLLGGCSP